MMWLVACGISSVNGASVIRAPSIPLQLESCWFCWEEQHVSHNSSLLTTRSTTRSFVLVTPPRLATLLVLRCLDQEPRPAGPTIKLKVRWPAFEEKSDKRHPCIPPKR